MQNVMENAKIQGIRQNLRPSWIRDFGLALDVNQLSTFA